MSDYAVIGHIDTHGEGRDGGAVADAFLEAIKSKRLIVITSEHQNEGKSTTSRLLAERITERGRPVLLIDADMRHSKLSVAQSRIKMYSQPPKPYIETAKYYDGYDIISFHERTQKPEKIIASKQFAELLSDAKERFEVVIIDTPPLSHFDDAMEISKMAEGVVFIHALTKPEIETEMDNVVGVITTTAAGMR